MVVNRRDIMLRWYVKRIDILSDLAVSVMLNKAYSFFVELKLSSLQNYIYETPSTHKHRLCYVGLSDPQKTY